MPTFPIITSSQRRFSLSQRYTYHLPLTTHSHIPPMAHHQPPPPHSAAAVSTLPPPSRLLLPRVRSSPASSPRPSRFSRARSPPLPHTLVGPIHETQHATALEWLGLPLNFDVVEHQLQIDGYQMYAVEKWSALSLVYTYSIRLIPSPHPLVRIGSWNAIVRSPFSLSTLAIRPTRCVCVCTPGDPYMHTSNTTHYTKYSATHFH